MPGACEAILLDGVVEAGQKLPGLHPVAGGYKAFPDFTRYAEGNADVIVCVNLPGENLLHGSRPWFDDDRTDGTDCLSPLLSVPASREGKSQNHDYG